MISGSGKEISLVNESWYDYLVPQHFSKGMEW